MTAAWAEDDDFITESLARRPESLTGIDRPCAHCPHRYHYHGCYQPDGNGKHCGCPSSSPLGRVARKNPGPPSS